MFERFRTIGAVLAIAASVGGCGSSRPPTLVVFAASSLTAAFTDIDAEFQVDPPVPDDEADLTVEFTFAGSAGLLAQLVGGAEADVLAAADEATMEKAARAGLLAGEPVIFATNTLTIVVAPGNPMHVSGFGDLARPGLAVVVCAPQVPCGTATAKLAERTGTRLAPVSEESAVGDVLTKVTSGQADAGVVYSTDARAAGDAVAVVAVPEAADVVNTYPIALLKGARDPERARRFIALVTGEEGRRVLVARGFGPP